MAQKAPFISRDSLHVHWSGFGMAFSFAAIALNMHYK
jgi:hypothetical protein